MTLPHSVQHRPTRLLRSVGKAGAVDDDGGCRRCGGDGGGGCRGEADGCTVDICDVGVADAFGEVDL